MNAQAPVEASMDYMTTAAAFNTLQEAIKTDAEYAWAWHCNIAVHAADAGCDMLTANLGAARFMDATFGVDTAKSPYWSHCQWAKDERE